jgi:hypothetical protein
LPVPFGVDVDPFHRGHAHLRSGQARYRVVDDTRYIRTDQSFGSAQPCSLSAMIERPRRTHRGVCGRRVRVFVTDTGPDMALDLVESRAFPKGITIQVYRPAGRPQYATG